MIYDKTFCMCSKCMSRDCDRHITQVPSGMRVSIANLYGTEDCLYVIDGRRERWEEQREDERSGLTGFKTERASSY